MSDDDLVSAKIALTNLYHILHRACVLGIILFLVINIFLARANAGDIALGMERYTQRNGIDNSYIFEMSQDRQGYIYLSTMRGIYFFSGIRFHPLHMGSSFLDANRVAIIRQLPDGKILLSDGHSLSISTTTTSPRHSPATLSFNVLPFDHVGQILGVFVDNEEIFLQDRAGLHECSLIQFPLSFSCFAQIIPGTAGAVVYQVGMHTFVVLAGSAFVRDVRGKKVFSLSQRTDFLICPNEEVGQNLCIVQGKTLISAYGKGEFSKAKIDWDFQPIDLGGKPSFAAASPDATIFFDGNWLRSFNGKSWSFLNYDLSRQQEITFAFVDRDRQLWTAQDLVELDKLIGWGDWENLEPQNIRSIWSVFPMAGERLAFTGQGIYLVEKNDITVKLSEGNYFIADQDRENSFWSPVDDAFLLHCKYLFRKIHCDRRFRIDRVTGLASSKSKDILWISSDQGLLSLSSGEKEMPHFSKDANGKELAAPASAIALRSDGVPWAVVGNALYFRREDGRWVSVVRHWPNASNFYPIVMVFSSRNDLWIGGLRARNGLLHLTLDGNRVNRIEQVDSSAVGSQIIFSLLWDKRHRLWVGTENGLAGYDGHQWIRVTKDDGLISANINQQGLSEDQDGTIWITTSRGVSHLMHPEHLFLKQNLDPVFVKVMLGERLLPEKAVPYTRDPLMVTLGTLNTALASTTYYRYRLDGVDQNWITTTTGEIRYNFIPPGRSRLIVQALNDNRNLVSDPIVLEIRMQRPWWNSWPLITLYMFSVVGLPYTLNKLRFRYLMKRQHRLEALVEERTTEMRAAQAALEQQARQDGLTKLMNRRTAEASVKRLLEKLSRPDDLGIMQSATLALFDIDHFKSINDRFGHAIGDEILTGIGARLLQAKRQEEIIGRHGGEEFLIVLQGEFIEAQARITTLLAMLSDVPFETKAGTLSIGCSAGIARTWPEEAWEDALERADQALYKAKIEGRGRIIVSEQDQNDEDYPG